MKGTSRGTITDIDGNFTLEIPANAQIQISYIGYLTQDIAVGNKTSLAIQLVEDTQNLEEVVVVGYGTKKKINLTGAVAAIDGKALVQTPVTNLSNAVAGRMPGVLAVNSSGEPSSGSTLSIRGNSTLNNNDPLIVVDGVPRDNFQCFRPE